MWQEDGITVPRHAQFGHLLDNVLDATQVMQECVAWESCGSVAVSYLSEDGSGSAVVLAFTIPISDTDARLAAFMLPMDSVHRVCTGLMASLMAIHGKDFNEVARGIWDGIRTGDVPPPNPLLPDNVYRPDDRGDLT